MVILSEKLVLAKSRAKDLSGVKNLNCWGANVSEINVLEKIPNVEVINFSANSIENLSPFSCCVHLRELYLRRNKLQSVEEVIHLKELKNLKLLWLAGNPFCENIPDEIYRLSVLKLLPNLQKLDDKLVTEDELLKALEITIEERGGGGDGEVAPLEDENNTDDNCEVEQNVGEGNKPDNKQVSTPQDGVEEPTNIVETTGVAEDNIELNNDEKHSLLNPSNSEKVPCESETSEINEESNPPPQCSIPDDPPSSSSASDKTLQESSSFTQLTSSQSEDDLMKMTKDKTYNSAIQMSLDETNKLRIQLGLKPLSVAKYETSTSPKKIVAKKSRRIKESTRNNLLSATLSLVSELDTESLMIIQDAIQERLNYSFEDNQMEETRQHEKTSLERIIVDILETG